MPLLQDQAGEGVRLHPRPRRETRSPEQASRRRNLLWLHAVEKGMYDPVQCRVRRHTTAELAELWGTTPRTVQRGIADSRKTLEEIDELFRALAR